MTPLSPSRRALRALAGAAVLAAMPGMPAAFAQTPPASSPPVVTRVLAIGHLTAKATPAALPAVLAREVPATLALYLAGRIDSWYATADQTEVVFLLNATTPAEAHALLDPLPLGQAGMMTFTFTPVGPLRPLGLLLRPAK
jgi:hypothetical protein